MLCVECRLMLRQDVYIMMSMTVLVLVCIWHAIIPQIAADWGLELAHTSDVVVLVLLGSIFVILHIVFALWIAVRVRVHHTLIYKNNGQKDSLSVCNRIGLHSQTLKHFCADFLCYTFYYLFNF